MKLNKKLNQYTMNAVEEQLNNPESPYVREHYERLIEMGYSPAETKNFLGALLINEMWEMGTKEKKFDEESYIKKLEKLPEMPWKEEENETIVKEDKIGRNDSCPCGSGKKYKKCCGK